MNQEQKKEDGLELIDELAQKIGEAAEAYRQLESLGYSDHYIKQELEEGYMGSLPEKLSKLREEIEEGEFDDEEEELCACGSGARDGECQGEMCNPEANK